MFHHCTKLETLVYGVIKSSTKYSIVGDTKEDFDDFYIKAYKWWESEMGFYPLFLSVGKTYDDLLMTGYMNQWRRIVRSRSEKINGKYKIINTLRKAGEFPNYVLFSFDEHDGIFTDYDAWHIVLSCAGGDIVNGKSYDITKYQMRQLLKPSFSRSDWLRFARHHPHGVQLISRTIDFRKATRIWVRNKATKKIVEGMGFKNVQVKRLKIDNF